MSSTPYKNIPNLAVADYVCRNDGRACALLSGTVLVFELQDALVTAETMSKLSRYLRVAGMSAAHVAAWGYDSQGAYKPGYHNVVQLSAAAGSQVDSTDLPVPPGVAPGDTWYFAVHMAPFNRHLLKVFLETL